MNSKYVLVRENGEQWINSPNNGGECCETKAETVVELNRLLARIKRLDEFVDQLTNPKFTRDDLSKEALLQRIKRLEEFANRFLNPEDLGWAIGKYDRDEARGALGKERVESK